jgi:hypothetical protein
MNKGKSQWTLKTLHDHLVATINGNDERYEQRFQSTQVAMDAALAAAKEAVTKAEIASEKRFDNVNEFRGTLADQQRTLMPRSEADLLIKTLSDRIEANNKSLTDKIDANTKAISELGGSKTGAQSATGSFLQAGAIVVAILLSMLASLIAIILHFIK